MVILTLLPVLLLAGIALLVVLVMRRGGNDPKGRRPLAGYLLTVMFVSLFASVFGVQQLASALIRGTLDVGSVQGVSVESRAVAPSPVAPAKVGAGKAAAEQPPRPKSPRRQPMPVPVEPRERVRFIREPVQTLGDALRGTIVAALGALVFAFHARRLRDLLAGEAADA